MTDLLAGVPFVARTVLPSPAGPMTALATHRGLSALLFATDRYHSDPHREVAEQPEHPHLLAARHWLDSYWHGGNPAWTDVPLDLHGSPFQQVVWQALLRIPLGHTTTYGQIAESLNKPSAPRAVGSAVGRNPVAVLVPCHRVIGRDGALTGYASGIPIKQQLLQHEGILLT
jgi:methylated-DNA-[protein]-cysteine S-methyltransferase